MCCRKKGRNVNQFFCDDRQVGGVRNLLIQKGKTDTGQHSGSDNLDTIHNLPARYMDTIRIIKMPQIDAFIIIFAGRRVCRFT